jgi:hypothetical protein
MGPKTRRSRQIKDPAGAARLIEEQAGLPIK